MPETHQDIPVTQGDDEPFLIKIYKADGVTPATSGDVASASAAWRWFPVTRVGQRTLPGLTIGTKSTNDVLTLASWTDPADGATYQTVQGKLTHDETAALTYPGSYAYECKVTISGQVTTITVGDLPLRAQPK